MKTRKRLRKLRPGRSRRINKKLGVIVDGKRLVTVRLFKTDNGMNLQFREKWSRRPLQLSLLEAWKTVTAIPY